MNTSRSQLRWPAARLAAITLLGFALTLSLLLRERSGSDLGQMNRRGVPETSQVLKDDATPARFAPGESYRVDLLSAGSLRNINRHPDANGYGSDTLHDPTDVLAFGPSTTAVRTAHETAKLPPEAVRRWLLPAPR